MSGLDRGGRGVAAAFAVSGVVHLVRPQVFERIVPRWLPAHRALVHGSGVAELVCAAGLARRRSRRWAGPASAALLLAVWPANLQMALDARKAHPAYRAAVWARLPLQVPLIRAALRAGR